jgi:tetratricopeptide (TPR) repeat protein
LGAIVGALTNLLTTSWNWWLFGITVVLVTFAAYSVVVSERTTHAPLDSSGGRSPEEPTTTAAAAVSNVPTPRQLPPDIVNFTGRDEEVHQLTALLERADDPMSTAATICAVSGKGGVGKTALAVHVGHQVERSFPGGQLYVDLRGVEQQPLDPFYVLAEFLAALGVDQNAIPDTVDGRQNLYRSRLADREVLVVLDNASAEAQVRPLLPNHPTCAAIVTSRRPLAALDTSGNLALEILTQDDGTALLAKIVGARRVDADPGATRELVRLCGFLPLAVKVAGAKLVARPHWTVADMVRVLGDGRRRLSALQIGDLEVIASFTSGYEGQDERQRRAFRLLGLLSFTDFPAWVIAAFLDEPPQAGDEVAEELCEAQLIEVASRTRHGSIRYRFHDLMRDFANSKAMATDPVDVRTSAIARVFGGYLTLAGRADTMLEPGVRNIDRSDAPLWCDDQEEFITANICGDPQGWFATERTNLVLAVGQSVAYGLTAQAWELAGLFAAFFAVRIYPREWEETHVRALAACVAAGDHRGEAFVGRSLGRLRRYQGQWREARNSYDRALELFERLGERLWTGVVHRNVGDLQTDLGRYQDAMEEYFAALRVFHDLGDRQWEAVTLISLGGTYVKQGKTNEAIDCFERCLPIFAEADHVWWRATTLVELGGVYLERADYPNADRFLREGMGIFRDLGDERRTALTQLSMGKLYTLQDMHERADEAFTACLASFRQAGDSLCEARTLDAMGDMAASNGDAERAKQAWDSAMSIFATIGAPEEALVRAKQNSAATG